MSPSRVLTAILNWNQPAMSAECARAALAQDAPGGHAVLVIDNGPTAANAAALRAALPPGCRLVATGRNLGFAGGMNVGIREAVRGGHEFVWLLNNDAFPDPGCLPDLVAALEADPTLACVTPALVHPDGREQKAGATLRLDPLSMRALSAERLAEPVGAGFWLSGAALLFRTRALAGVGGFDPRFFAYMEEVDLCQRLAAAGYRFRAVPAARCVHLTSASTGGSESPFTEHMITRNAWLCLRKHLPPRRLPAALLRLLADQLERAGSLSTGPALAVVGGTVAGFAGRTWRPTRVRASDAVAGAVLVCPRTSARVLRRVARVFDLATGTRP